MSLLPCLTLALCLTASPGESAATRIMQPWERARLSKENAKFLDSLFDIGLFDPKGAYRVSITLPERLVPAIYFHVKSSDEKPETSPAEGWLVRGKFGLPDRVHFASGDWVYASAGKVERLDFVSEFHKTYVRKDSRRLVILDGISDFRESHILFAAWLHRLGHDNLAAYLLGEYGANGAGDEARIDSRKKLSRRLNKLFEQSFATRSDSDALAFARLLKTRFADRMGDFPNFEPIQADINRRNAEKRTGPPSGFRPPRWFAFWPVEKRVQFLIRSLDEINGSENVEIRSGSINAPIHFTRMHGTGDVQYDRRIHALVQIGDAAIPALIETMISDGRLTRFVNQDIDFRGGGETIRQTISVRHVAQRAISMILQKESFRPALGTSADKIQEQAAAIRSYWTRYGHMPFEERMMSILTDKSEKASDRREAARNLAAISQKQWLREDLHRRSWNRERQNAVSRTESLLTPIARRFRSPTIGEAVLSALDDEYRSTPAKEREDFWDNVTLYYSEIFTNLRDYRIAGELCRWVEKTEDHRERFELARLCRILGADGPIRKIAREIEHGSLWRTRRQIKRDDEQVKEHLRFIAYALSGLNDTDSELGEACFRAVQDRRHPWRASIVEYFLEQTQGNPLNDCPAFVLEILRQTLSDPTPTDRKLYLRGKEIQEFDHNSKARYNPLPIDAADPNLWKESVEETRGDRAAELISNSMIGFPQPHPLRKDRDGKIAMLDELTLRFAKNCRSLSGEEVSKIFGFDFRQLESNSRRTIDLAIPDIRPLNRLATAEDVRRGCAIFEQNGQGNAADFKEPVWIYLKSEAQNPHPRAGLAVQAEIGPDGKLIYGVIFRHEMRVVEADEVGRIEPFKPR